MHPPLLQDWIKELLSKNGLTRPDGRPLYAYRVSDESYEQLFELLRNKTNISLELAVRRTSNFAQGWMVYAAEWWKRSYAGGPWTWSPIFKELGYGDPEPNTRSDWVETASNYWKLNDDAIGGKKYLGKVVVNGGLPLKLIREADGALSRLLHVVLNEAMRSGSQLNSAQILSQIEVQRSYLPKSYRQPTVYILLAQVINTVLELKEKLINSGDQDAVAYLDKTHPDWLDGFPLRIDTDSAHRLLGKLIRQARQAMKNEKRPKQPFSIIRQVRFNDDFSEWRYECLLDASSRYPLGDVAHMLNCPEDALPASLDLVIVSGSTSNTIGQMLRRDNDYLITLKNTELKSEFFHRSLRLDVARLGQILGTLEIQGGEGPDPFAPWIFEDSNPISRLLWAGSYKLRAGSCVVIAPEDSNVIANSDNVLELGSAFDKKAIRVVGGEVDVSIQNEVFQIKCGAHESDLAEGIVWGNNRLLLDSSPSHIFVGVPKLVRVDSEGVRRSVPSSELFWRCNNVDTTIDSIRHFGMGTLFWRRNGITLIRLRAICLQSPKQANISAHIEYVFCKERKPTGTIKLNGWPISSVICNTENISIQSKNINSQWELKFVSDVSPPPLTLSLTLAWPSGSTQRLSLPFPIEGAFIVNDNDTAINTTALVSLKQANHLRAHLRGIQSRAWQIHLRLENASLTQRIPDLVVKFRPIPDVTSQVVRFYDLQNQIRQLLSLTTELDARVRVSFECSGSEKVSIHVSRYSHNLDRDTGKGWVTLNNASGAIEDSDILEQSELRAVPILSAEQASRNLPAVFSQDTHVGSWCFQPEIKQSGTWLIYPSEESRINARPITWYVSEPFAKPESAFEGLKAAMNIKSREDRIAAMVEAFKLIAETPDHQDWKYVQVCVDKFGHLPLASLDLWVAITHVPRAVVCAFLSLEDFTEKIADRICNELPFEWLLTSPQDWLSVISKLRKLAMDRGGERDERFLKNDLEFRLEWIQERCPGIFLSVKLALVKGLEIEHVDRDTRLLIEMPSAVVSSFLPQLLTITNPNSDVANFIRRAAQSASYDVPAPSQLKNQTTKFAQSESGRKLLEIFKFSDTSDFKYSLVIAPMMIAYSVANGESSSWIEKTDQIYALRQYREFDRHWFDESYKVAMACAFKEGLITV